MNCMNLTKQLALKTSAIFLSPSHYLSLTGGGVQWCTQDYLETVKHAGFVSEVCTYSTDRSIRARLLRRLYPQPFRNEHSSQTIAQVIAHCQRVQARYLFLNNISALSIAPFVRHSLPETKMVFLSHGVESTDHLNSLRLCPETLPSWKRGPKWIGRMLLEETRQRDNIDGVVCISEEDMVFEKWLGAQRTCFIPRSITLKPLKWRPQENRVGTVSTLDHPPNLDGIRKLAASLRNYPQVRFRIVGGPPAIGRQLQSSFEAIEYVGALTDENLQAEASTWCGFVNPIFCQARGASTKVATALGWGLPLLTTPTGTRGYVWSDHLMPRVETPDALAQIVSETIANPPARLAANARRLAEMAPSLEEAGKRLRSFVESM
jgi:hypothetical protein